MRKRQTLLIVEDSSVNRKILRRILTTRDFDVLEAENGQVALDILMDKENDISLVLLDLSMPVMNGYEMLKVMKKTGLLTTIPVIVTTGNEKEKAEIASLECGASDFIIKPYNPDIVYHRVQSILRLCDNAALISKLEIDRLTGVYTREAFYRYAQIKLDENPDTEYDIVCSDIENFKMINSKYGIRKGDELLRYVAAHFVECIGEEGVCGRMGSDTFAVLRKSRPCRSQEEISDLFEKTYSDSPVGNFVMQYGIYPKIGRDIPISDYCDCAKLAIASIKHRYGIFYAVYDDSMKQKILREHQLTDYMEQALEDNQFVVYLQPKHDVTTGKIAGAEALVRWIHPEIGFISPGEFIPLFEKNGFITKLDQYVWEIVCKVLQRWKKQGKTLIPISVNASRMDFESENLTDIIEKMVDFYDVPHNMIHFEVTESAYTDNPHQIIGAVSNLQSMGFRIEMDDFGSGYSSLNMLSELPIDLLKLDMKFMQNDSKQLSGNKRSILSFIVSLSKWLQLPTIAEGVETKEEVELLRTMGCNYIQGYYFAKPMPIEDFENYMKEKMTVSQAAQQEDKKVGTVKVNSKHKKQVLVVDDIECNRELIRLMLEEKYQVVTAENGKQAYEYLKEHAAEVSCILLDLLMPVMDGFQFLDCVREDGILDQIPVIISSEEGSDSELRALRLGAVSFVSKPYNKEILLHHVLYAVDEHDFRQLISKQQRG